MAPCHCHFPGTGGLLELHHLFPWVGIWKRTNKIPYNFGYNSSRSLCSPLVREGGQMSQVWLPSKSRGLKEYKTIHRALGRDRAVLWGDTRVLESSHDCSSVKEHPVLCGVFLFVCCAFSLSMSLVCCLCGLLAGPFLHSSSLVGCPFTLWLPWCGLWCAVSLTYAYRSFPVLCSFCFCWLCLKNVHRTTMWSKIPLLHTHPKKTKFLCSLKRDS